jgi:TonB family protein
MPTGSRIPFSERPGGSGRLVIVQPLWETAPTHADVAAARPKSAEEGHVVLQCDFNKDRTLHGCESVQERPRDQGFKQAALALTHKFRAQARADLHPRDGDEVRLPFTFDAPGATEDTAGAVIKPEWAALPDADSFASLFPAAARTAKVTEGRGSVDCRITENGRLDDCRLVNEAPQGLGFGAAALKAASGFQVNPWTSDGRAVDGVRITVPIHFVDGDAPPAPVPAPKP